MSVLHLSAYVSPVFVMATHLLQGPTILASSFLNCGDALHIGLCLVVAGVGWWSCCCGCSCCFIFSLPGGWPIMANFLSSCVNVQPQVLALFTDMHGTRMESFDMERADKRMAPLLRRVRDALDSTPSSSSSAAQMAPEGGIASPPNRH